MTALRPSSVYQEQPAKLLTKSWGLVVFASYCAYEACLTLYTNIQILNVIYIQLSVVELCHLLEHLVNS